MNTLSPQSQGSGETQNDLKRCAFCNLPASHADSWTSGKLITKCMDWECPGGKAYVSIDRWNKRVAPSVIDGNAGLAAPGVAKCDHCDKPAIFRRSFKTGENAWRLDFCDEHFNKMGGTMDASVSVLPAPPARPVTTEMEEKQDLGLKEADVNAGDASKAAITVPMIWREADDLIICKLPTQAWDARISNEGARVLLIQLLEVVYGKRHAHEVLRMAEGVPSVGAGGSSLVSESPQILPPATEPSDTERLEKALGEARKKFNNILGIWWGWDGDCGATKFAEDGLDIVDEALNLSAQTLEEL